MIASHNQKSIERAVSLMHELGVEPQQSGIYFGQLLGMADHLTFILGRNGYRVSILQLACSTFNPFLGLLWSALKRQPAEAGQEQVCRAAA